MDATQGTVFRILFVFCLLSLGLPLPGARQQERHEEFVEVLNAELILRVLKDGSPVSGLKKSDFSLFEDGEKREINGFLEVHRRIAPTGAPVNSRRQPRLFLLFFWVAGSSVEVEEALDRFFSGVFRPGDRVILSTPEKAFDIVLAGDADRVRSEFLEQWRREAKLRRAQRLRFVDDLNRLLETHVVGATVQSAAERMKSQNAFCHQYDRALQEHRLRELTPDTEAFAAMARSLLAVANEKFALVFFQRDSLPLLDIAKVADHCLLNGMRVEQVDRLRESLEKIELQARTVMNVRSFPEKLRSAFIQANTQFHFLFLDSDSGESPDDASRSTAFTKSEDVLSGWDLLMRSISESTGGLVLAGARMTEAMDQVISFQDTYYHLTYVPRDQGAGKRRIDIRLNQPGMTILHGRTLELKDPPRVSISSLAVADGRIRLTVADFYAVPRNGVATGLVSVVVTGRPGEREPSRLLAYRVHETSGEIELPVAFPWPGIWDVQADVVDQFTGRRDVRQTRVEAAAVRPAQEDPPDLALASLLDRAAAYAEKLKREAFHFVCREDVTQEVFVIDELFVRRLAARDYWKYDYQIVGLNGKISESRVLLEKNRRRMRLADARLESAFHSLFSFYMPVTLLAGEKQLLYRYRLLDRTRIKNAPVWRVAVARRDPLAAVPWGEVWIRESDGAVLKIQIEQDAILGFARLVDETRQKKGFVPEVTTLHEYGIEKGGVRFPSRTVFIERLKSDDNAMTAWGGMAAGKTAPRHFSFERSRTYFEYSRHRFFSVSTRVEESGA